MKKVLAVFAVLAVCSFGSMAFAAHEVGNVDQQPVVGGMLDIYGVAKVSVDLIDTGSKDATKTRDGVTKISSNSSRLGFKGAESVGGGLWAIFQLELGYNVDVAGSNVTLRNTYVGLTSKSLGELKIGNHDTPYKLSTGKLDNFGDTMGDYNAIIGNVNGTSNFENRLNNVIQYNSPTWAGVHLMAAMNQESESEKAADKRANSASFAVVYSGGPLYATVAQEIHNKGVKSFATTTTGYDAAKTITGTRLGVGYDMKATGTKLGLVYEMLKDDNDKSAFTRNAWNLAVSQKLGNETINLAYGVADDGDSAAKTGASRIAVGVDHKLSKRTTAYVLYAQTTNDKDATYGLGQGGAGGAYKPGKDEDPSVISIGLNHAF